MGEAPESVIEAQERIQTCVEAADGRMAPAGEITPPRAAQKPLRGVKARKAREREAEANKGWTPAVLPEGAGINAFDGVRAAKEPDCWELTSLWVPATDDLRNATVSLTLAGWEPINAVPHTMGLTRGSMTYWKRRVGR